MRKIFAVMLTAGVALCCAQSAEAQSAKRILVAPTKLQDAGAVTPAAPAALAPDALDTRSLNLLDPALVAKTGSRAIVESGMLPSHGPVTASAAGPFGPPCQVACVGTAEAEACGADTNGGCTLDFCMTPGFDAIASGQVICGTVFADMGVRDLDYYAVPVPAGPSLLTINFTSEFEGQVFLIESGAAGGGECSFSIVLETDFSAGCNQVTIQRTVASLQYYVAVTTGNAAGPIFDGVTCAAGDNQYRLEVTVADIAACLACVGTTEVDACGLTPDTNDGCNFAGPPFPFSGPVAVGPAPVTLCGNASTGIDPVTMAQARDTDWWEITVPAGSSDVTIDFTSEFPGQLFVVNDQMADCAALVVIDDANSGSCITTSVTVQTTSGAGRYLLFVSTGDINGPLFDGVPCGGANDYQLTITAVPAACAPNCGLVCVGTAEGEACPAVPSAADMFNGGCNSPNNAFSPIIVDGGPVCGNGWADSGTRDTDWYTFTVFANTTVTLTINSEMPVGCFVLEEINGAAGALTVPCNLANVNAPVVLDHPGNCAAIMMSFPVTIDPAINQRTYAIFVGAGTAAAAAFSGFPCMCDNGYSLELSTAAMANCNFPTGMIESDCVTGNVNVNLVAASAYTAAGVTIDYNGFGAAAGVTGQVVIPGPFAIGAAITTSIALGAGDYTFDFTGTCSAGGTFAAVAAVGHYPYSGETDLIFAGEGAGCVDSVAAIEAALTANNRTSLTINNQVVLVSDYDCLTNAGVETIWVVLGTFPNNVPLLAAEGTALRDAITLSDISVYVEGSDVWGFDAPTDLFDVDGVQGTLLDGTVILDGDDSLTSLIGAVTPGLDTSGLGATYNQDNLNNLQGFPGEPGFDYTDQLIASAGTDLPAGSTHSVIFTDGGALYGVAIASEGPDDTTGKVISSSFEFGGYGGSQNALMTAYLGFLKEISTDPDFKRGDCNNDGGINIADAIYLLGALFPGPGGPNAIACEDACDANDDGGRNIADAIALLASLFGSPPVMLPAPGSVCGQDPTTMDVFGCVTPSCP
ncbi:MAG: hypothetical protein AB7O52_06640 [Planctomycetota bacterium]